MAEPLGHGNTVLDVGCGWGGFGEWLNCKTHYQGVDVSSELIKQVRNLDVYHGDVLNIGVLRWEYVVGQGLFYKQENYNACRKILAKMWELATKAVVITTILCGEENELSFNIPQLLSWVRAVGCEKWTLRHDYHPNDVCLYLYK